MAVLAQQISPSANGYAEFIHAQRRMKKNWGIAKAATFLSMAMSGGGGGAKDGA